MKKTKRLVGKRLQFLKLAHTCPPKQWLRVRLRRRFPHRLSKHLPTGYVQAHAGFLHYHLARSQRGIARTHTRGSGPSLGSAGRKGTLGQAGSAAAPATQGQRLPCTRGDPGGSRRPPARFGEEKGKSQELSIRAPLPAQCPPPRGPPCRQRDRNPKLSSLSTVPSQRLV